MKAKILIFPIFCLGLFKALPAQLSYPGINPGKAQVKSENPETTVLENRSVSMELSVNNGRLKLAGFHDNETGYNLIKEPLPLFEVKLKNGTVITSDNFRLRGKPEVRNIAPDQSAPISAEREAGIQYSAYLEDRKSGISLRWEAVIRDGSNYIRQLFRFSVTDENSISRITLVKLPSSSGAVKIGNVDGSPLVVKNIFVALEYPLANVENDGGFTMISVPRLARDLSTVWGVTPARQLRRGFLYYVERERAHPYHQVLHYNSWFDISWGNRKFDENESIDRIRLFGDSLIRARNINMKGFLFDDGWDDNRTLWKFHSGFPDGFTNLKTMAKSYGSDVGVWMSPFGGYGEPKNSRIEYGNRQNPPFETNKNGFSLSGPVYYNRFKDVTSDFILKYDICMFKFDGVGAGVGAGSGDLVDYQKDVEAFLNLLRDLLKLKPDIYMSLTTGTWPSVYWLKFGDNIWRGGDDTNMTGEGSKRQQWITYRDADVFKNIVQRGPLFPLNSLMTCGICIADNGNPGIFEMDAKDISDEIWSFFATGTNLQELYINPHRLNKTTWDCLAAAARWAKDNEPVMTDVHWIGGDPGKGEVYGYAAWSQKKSVVSLRNPTSRNQVFHFNAREIFEIPDGYTNNYLFTDVISELSNAKKSSAEGNAFMIILKPFEVRVFDAVPLN